MDGLRSLFDAVADAIVQLLLQYAGEQPLLPRVEQQHSNGKLSGSISHQRPRA
jgi:hypothetical protein